MRNLILTLATGAALCATGAVVEAMPVATVSGAATPTAQVEKTAVIVRRTTVIRRPARRVCTTRIGALGRRVTVCR